MTLCSVWCALASSYSSLLAARIFQAIGGAAADTVAPALVGDLYFIHQRGRAMVSPLLHCTYDQWPNVSSHAFKTQAVYTILLCVGPIVGGIAGGYLAFRHGWHSVFWVSVALSGLCFLGVAVFVPETLFHKTVPLEQYTSHSSHVKEDKQTNAEAEEAEQVATYKPYSFGASLGMRIANKQPHAYRHFLRPWRTLALPGTWLVMLHYSGLVGGIVTITTVGPQLLAMPPYLWKENVGLINIGGLIGAAAGYLYTHLLSDRIMRRSAMLSRRGTLEAEDRLPTLAFPLAVATCGFFVFGFCAEYPGLGRWVGLQFGFGMLAFGLMQVPSVGFNYVSD